MLINSLFAFAHFVAVFGIAATLFYEWLSFGKSLSHKEARRIQMCDLWYGFFAMLVLAAGFARVFWFEKGSGFYFSNPFFLIKLALFVTIGLLSIYPTLKFIGWRSQIRQGQGPIIGEQEYARIALILNIEMALLLAMILSASLMAKGIGS